MFKLRKTERKIHCINISLSTRNLVPAEGLSRNLYVHVFHGFVSLLQSE